MVAAEALDGEDRALGEPSCGHAQRVLLAGEIVPVTRGEQGHAGPAHRASIRLGVKAPVSRILVLLEARFAHRKAGHRRQRPVVRHPADDREPWPAVRAIRERIAVPAIRGVEQLTQAVDAGRAVRGDERVGRPTGAARGDPEVRLAGRRQRLRRDLVDRRERRQLADEARHEALDPLPAALDLEQHPVLVIEDVAAERLLVREPVHEWPEADALDGATHPRPDPEPAAAQLGHSPQLPRAATPTSSRSTWYALACASWIRGMCSERRDDHVIGELLGEIRPPS